MVWSRGIATAATRMRRLPHASATLVVLAFALLVVAGAEGAGPNGAAQTTQVTLEVLAGPDPNADGDDVVITELNVAGENICDVGFSACEFTYLAPTTVTLTAKTTHPDYHFYGWTAVECTDGVNVCELRLTGDETTVSVFALYDPTSISVGVAGPGTVKWLGGVPPEQVCLSQATLQTSCRTEDVPARVPIEFVAESGSSIHWAVGCDPVPNVATRCVARPEDRIVMVGFDGEAPPRPFEVDVTLRLAKTGGGDGRITGSGFNCGSGVDCRQRIDFGELVTLQAEAAAGSRFDGWVGVCASEPTCRFRAGPVTSLQARFVEAPPPPDQPPPTEPPPREPQAPKLDVRITKLTAFRSAGRWRVAARIVTNKPIRTRARVGRMRQTWGDRTVNLRAGRSTLTLQLARRARSGKCWFALIARTAGGERLTLPRRTVKLGR
jgi:Divergent InlB B-repeat domain